MTGTTRYQHLTIPLGATYDSRDVALDATKGYYVDADFVPFIGISGSETGAAAIFDTRAYKSFGEDARVVFAGRIQGGSILGASLTGTPNDYRFYSGGGGTVRGQDYQSLGDLGGGVKSGGRSFLDCPPKYVQKSARISALSPLPILASWEPTISRAARLTPMQARVWACDTSRRSGQSDWMWRRPLEAQVTASKYMLE